MKAYVYTASECGLEKFSDGRLRLNAEITTDVSSADVFVVPESLHTFRERGLSHLPYIAQHSRRHVFWDVTDWNFDPIFNDCIFIRSGLTKSVFIRDPNSIPWPWPVDDFGDHASIPESGFKFDLSFQGWNWSPARKHSIDALVSANTSSLDFATSRDFTGYIYHTPEGVRRRAEFSRSMHESRLALCPESIPGVIPYRFYEAMSCARIPILVGDDYVLPFSDEINYDDFAVFVSNSRIGSHLAKTVKLLTTTLGDEILIGRGLKARAACNQWLHRDKWTELLTYSVAKAIKKIQ